MFIHSAIDGHLDCFHLLTIVNSTAVNMQVCVLFECLFSVLWGIYLETELWGHVVILRLTF